MIKSVNDVKHALSVVWPGLYHRWFDQREYWVPDAESVKSIIPKTGIREEMTFRPGICECEAFAQALWVGFKRHLIDEAEYVLSTGRTLPERLSRTWVFGVARGLNFPSTRPGTPHALNFALTQSGVMLVEPQTYQIWEPGAARKDTDDNFVFFVEV